jgi:transcriptional regulator with XRE-family HTH domain
MTRTTDEMFGLAVRAKREERGWSMSEFAAMLSAADLRNFHPTTVGRLERGERPVRLTEAQVIAAVLGSSIDGLVGEHVEAVHRRWINALQELEHAVLRFATERERLADSVERMGPADDPIEEENLALLRSKLAVTVDEVVARTLTEHADELGIPRADIQSVSKRESGHGKQVD